MAKKLTRLPDWHEYLKLYIDRCSEQPFVWGKHDCLMFAAGAVKAQTGVDLVADIVGAYEDEEQAMLYLREHGYKTLRGAVTKKLGKPVHPAQAGKGDVVFVENDPTLGPGKKVGICAGTFSWFVGDTPISILPDGSTLKRHGLVYTPTLSCKLAWKVG